MRNRKKQLRKVNDDRSWALDAASVLNDVEGDLMMGRIALARVRKESNELNVSPLAIRLQERMCIFHMVLACAKFCEFRDKFCPLLNAVELGLVNPVASEIRKRGAITFRNTVVGHIWDEKRDRLVTPSLIDEGIRAMTRGDETATLEWLFPFAPSAGPSVYAAAKSIRESLCARHGLTAQEVLSR